MHTYDLPGTVPGAFLDESMRPVQQPYQVDSLLLNHLLKDRRTQAGDQSLSLWSGSTGSRTLDYDRTNPMEYQIVITHTKETT